MKKNNNFVCLSTPHLKLLDITNYLAPGFSYEKYLKAYKCTATKGFSPYEWMDNLSKLDSPNLPPHDTFFSSLKNTNISQEDYRYSQEVWQKERMQTFCDFLVWYNNRDVEPLLETVEKQFQFYKQCGLDVFKQGISVPGLMMRYLFNTLPAEVKFYCFGEHHKDLYHKVKEEIVGGPSIIFHRYHEKDVTKI